MQDRNAACVVSKKIIKRVSTVLTRRVTSGVFTLTVSRLASPNAPWPRPSAPAPAGPRFLPYYTPRFLKTHDASLVKAKDPLFTLRSWSSTPSIGYWSGTVGAQRITYSG